MIVALVVSVIMLVYSIVCCVGALETLNSGEYIVFSEEKTGSDDTKI
jgi:hypothetical protein